MEDQIQKALIGGIAARFANSGNLQEFWENLVNETDVLSASRWPQGLYNLPEEYGLLPNIDKFDNEFFDILDSEVDSLNPVFRQLLEVIYECIVDSCLPLLALQEARTGLYVACSRSDTDCIESSRCSDTDYNTCSEYLAGELIRWLKFQGPSVTVNSADNSGISALNLAINDLFSGRCTYAVVTGCDIVLNPLVTKQLHILEPHILRSEGCVAVLLSRRHEDLARIYCSVLDIEVDYDNGRQKEKTSLAEQSELINHRLQRLNNICQNSAVYIDNHGVYVKKSDSEAGDKVDEQIETLLLADSVNAHIGDTDSVAGLSTIITCILAFQHDHTAGSRGFQEIPIQNKISSTKPSPFVSNGNQGDGCSKYYLIIEPYLSSKSAINVSRGDMIVPFTVRNTEGMNALMDIVTSHRDNSAILGLLSQSLLSCDKNQPITGYILAGSNEKELAMFHEACDIDLDSLYLCLDDFMSSHVSMATDLLQLNCFHTALKQCQKSIQLLDPMLDIVSVLEKSEPLSPCTKVGILAAASLFMSMIDSLETIGLEFDGGIGCGLSEIIAAYMDGCISRDQCFLIYDVIGKQLELFSQKYGEKWVLYQVDIDYEEAYQLGPWVQVLAIHDKQHVTLAVEKERCGGVLEKILLKGGCFEQSSVNVPVYSLYMKELAESVAEQLKDIIPSPVRRSNRLISARTGWNQGQSQDQVLYSADYFAKLLCHPVNLFEAQGVAPPDCLVLSLKPSVNKNSKGPDEISSQKRGLQYSVLSTCTGFQDTKSSTCTNMAVHDHVTCSMSMKSLCHAIGKLHIHGVDVDVSAMYETTDAGPFGIEIPCFSPLVRWNHDISWSIPHWMEFSATVDEEKLPYMIDEEKGNQRPVGVLLYHVWKAISDIVAEQQPLCSIRLYGITGFDSDVYDSKLNGTQIFVLPQTGVFTAVLEDNILLRGKFDVDIKGDLPSVPGYDLDINENIDPSSSKLSDSDSDRTEVQWEDSWLDFMDSLLEFAEENLGNLPSELLVNTSYHHIEAKDCSNFLAVVEKYTGLCRAGGLVFRFRMPTSSDDLDLDSISITSQAVANQLMVYSVNNYKTQNSKILLFNGYKEDDRKPMVGIVNFAGEAKLTETQVHDDWKPEHMEIIIPYILAAYIVNDVAKVTEKQHVAILPPLDSVSMYMMVLCLERGCTVYTSTHDLETKQLLENMFPSLNVLHDERMYKELMCQSRGLGVDVCLRVSGGDIQKLLDCIAWNGHAIQCIPPDEHSYSHEHILRRNNSITVVDSAQAVHNFVQSADKNFQEIFSGINNELMQKLHHEGFPESIGMLYRQEVVARLEKSFPVNHLLQKLMEPDIEHNHDRLSQHDAKCIEKIQSLVSPKPKDFSVADTSCLLENPLKRIDEDDPFNTGMMATPTSQPTNSLSPNVNVITFSESFAESKVSPIASKEPHVAEKVLPTSTPLLCPMVQCVSKKLEESYLDDMTGLPACTETSFHIFNDSVREDREEFVVDDQDNDVEAKTSEPEPNKDQQCFEKLDTISEDKKVKNLDKEDTLNAMLLCKQNCKEASGNEVSDSSVDKKQFSNNGTNRILIEDEGVERSKPEETGVSKLDKDMPDKNCMLQESRVKTSNETIMPSKSSAHRPVPIHTEKTMLLVKRLSSLGFDRPPTPIVKKTPNRDLFRHRMLQKQNLVPPKLLLPKPRVDLLVFGRPMTPHTPDLQEVLSPRMAPNVVPLNSVENPDTPPLFIIHTITGCTNMFRNVAERLDFQCYGLQLTGATPTGSIDEMARYYKDVIVMKQNDGPYRIAGHSYSSILALEIAVCLQEEGKQVDYLVMFEGSPLLIQHQINQGLKHLTAKASKHEIDEALSIGALVSWIEHYGQVQNKLLTYGLLKKLPSLNERIETSVDFSFGTAIISCSPVKTKWLTAKEKVIQMMKLADTKTDRLADAAKELVRLKRRQRALDFIKQMQLAYTYQIQTQFVGNINLFRVKEDTQLDIAEDYGLQTLCDGEVKVKMYQATPEKFIASEAVQPLSEDLNALLNCKRLCV